MTYLERIKEQYPHFTPGFRKIADLILNHPLDVAFMTRRELAQSVTVDPTTVMRFTQALGYTGYRELAGAMKRYAREQLTTNFETLAEAESDEKLLASLQNNAQQVFQRFTETGTKDLARMLEALHTASHVWVAGEFVMYELARFFAKELQFLGKPATAFTPSPSETATYLSLMKPGQAVFALTVGHLGMDAGYAVRMAREQGLMTLCLTDNATILPAREAEITVVAPTNNTILSGSMVVPMVIMSLLWEGLTFKQPQKNAQLFTDIFSNIGQLRELRATVKE